MGTGRQVSGGDEVLCDVGKEEDGVGDDADRHGAVQWEKGVDVTPQEHDADDKEEVGAHFRERPLKNPLKNEVWNMLFGNRVTI